MTIKVCPHGVEVGYCVMCFGDRRKQSAADRAVERIERRIDEIEALRAEVENWKRYADEQARGKMAYSAEVEALKAEADTLRDVITLLKSDDSHALCRDDADRYQREVATVKAENERLVDACYMWEADVADLEAELHQVRMNWDAALKAANQRADTYLGEMVRLQEQMEELREAWGILQHDDFVVNGGDRANWGAHDEAKAIITRVLGGS